MLIDLLFFIISYLTVNNVRSISTTAVFVAGISMCFINFIEINWRKNYEKKNVKCKDLACN